MWDRDLLEKIVSRDSQMSREVLAEAMNGTTVSVIEDIRACFTA